MTPLAAQAPARVIDPVRFVELVWPKIKLYDKQKQIMYSVRDNDETFVPAGNALGKDFVSALIALWFFCSRRPAKVVTTSVKGDQLNDVLWGEIRRFIESAETDLPIQFNHLRIRQLRKDGTLVGNAELVGQVVNKGEALLGRHLARTDDGLPRTLCIFDEASGMESAAYESSDTWAHRKLIIGNPYPCANFFYNGVKAGDLLTPTKERYYRKVIQIKAIDSPNVRYALAEIAAGRTPSNRILVPGVIDYATYQKRRMLWDAVRQSIGLDAEFYEGAEVLLFPPDWLNKAARTAELLIGQGRRATHIGCDPAEGGDSTSWCVIDEYGIVDLQSLKTPDTDFVVQHSIELIKRHGINPANFVFDRGGGGKQHADRMRKMGYAVRTVAFGETVKPENRYRFRPKNERKEDDEQAYVFKNRRAEMYFLVRQLIDPCLNPRGFGIPDNTEKLRELRRQMAPLPLMYDGEGRIMLPPKGKADPNSKVVTIKDMIGCSPDEADSLALAVYGRMRKTTTRVLGALAR